MKCLPARKEHRSEFADLFVEGGGKSRTHVVSGIHVHPSTEVRRYFGSKITEVPFPVTKKTHHEAPKRGPAYFERITPLALGLFQWNTRASNASEASAPNMPSAPRTRPAPGQRRSRSARRSPARGVRLGRAAAVKNHCPGASRRGSAAESD